MQASIHADLFNRIWKDKYADDEMDTSDTKKEKEDKRLKEPGDPSEKRSFFGRKKSVVQNAAQSSHG